MQHPILITYENSCAFQHFPPARPISVKTAVRFSHHTTLNGEQRTKEASYTPGVPCRKPCQQWTTRTVGGIACFRPGVAVESFVFVYVLRIYGSSGVCFPFSLLYARRTSETTNQVIVCVCILCLRKKNVYFSSAKFFNSRRVRATRGLARRGSVVQHARPGAVEAPMPCWGRVRSCCAPCSLGALRMCGRSSAD